MFLSCDFGNSIVVGRRQIWLISFDNQTNRTRQAVTTVEFEAMHTQVVWLSGSSRCLPRTQVVLCDHRDALDSMAEKVDIKKA